MRSLFFFILFLLTIPLPGLGQGPENYRFMPASLYSLSLPMEFSQNLMIIPVRVNQGETMRFVLDTGINNTIITELAGTDTVSLKFAREISVAGLGDGVPLEGWFSAGNRIVIPASEDGEENLICDSSNIFVLTTDHFQLTRQLGVRVNGLIGSGLFNQFLVKIDPETRIITLFDRDKVNLKRLTRSFQRIPLIISNGKAYADVVLTQEDGSELTARLLIDTGASLSFWISPEADSLIRVPSKTIRSFLGQGLNGEISGSIGRISQARLGPFSFKKPLVSYPDQESLGGIMLGHSRHGSMGNDILRRFTVIMDYPDRSLYLKPNRFFGAPFTYNRSGMEVEKPIPTFPIYSVYSVIEGSPADLAGVREGDVIEYVNYTPVLSLTLDDINNILHGEEGKTVTLKINRNGESFRLKINLDVRI